MVQQQRRRAPVGSHRQDNVSVLMHMKLLFLFTVCLILWLFTNSAKKSTFMALTSHLPELNPTTGSSFRCRSSCLESCLSYLTEVR
jgi:hypothetical protein